MGKPSESNHCDDGEEQTLLAEKGEKWIRAFIQSKLDWPDLKGAGFHGHRILDECVNPIAMTMHGISSAKTFQTPIANITT